MVHKFHPISLAMILGAGCGDDLASGAADAAPELPPQRLHGALLLLETTFVDRPDLKSGPLLQFGPFRTQHHVQPPAVYEEAAGSPFACKVYEHTREQVLDRGVDIGTVEIEIDGGPAIPPCTLESDRIGWACRGPSGALGDISIVDDVAGVVSLTQANNQWSADDVGRLIEISGAAEADNNGTFPVVAVVGPDTIHYLNPGAVAETDTEATYATYAGRGPAGQDAMIVEGAVTTFGATPGPHPVFLEPWQGEVEFGEVVTPDTATLMTLDSLPMDGSPVSLSCDGEGGDCGQNDLTAITIETTDAPIPENEVSLGLDTGLPPPVDRSIYVRCLQLTGAVEIPAEAMQLVADSGATRVRTLFARVSAHDVITDNQETTLVVGHAVGGFTGPD